MSVLSIMKKSRQQAKEHAAKEPAPATSETKVPYKHVPTHAKMDALSGALNDWQRDYKIRIQEQNRRRSALAPLEKPVSSTAIPRISSSLSYVSFPSDYSSSASPLPKVQSFNSLPPTWQQRSPASHLKEDYFSQSSSRKGKEREIIPPVPALPLMYKPISGVYAQSSGKPSKVTHISRHSGSSSSSDGDLEVRPGRLPSYSISATIRPQGLNNHSYHGVSGTAGLPNSRLSHQRKISGQSDRYYSQTPRSHRFTAPQPIDYEALSLHNAIPAFPTPPVSVRESANTSPATSNSVSYASSNRSVGSTTPSSTVSTPAASIIASFPSSDRLSSKAKNGTQRLASDAKPLREVKMSRWSFLSSKRPASTAA